MAAQKVKDNKMNWLAAQMGGKVRIQEDIVAVLKEEREAMNKEGVWLGRMEVELRTELSETKEENNKLQQRVAQLEEQLKKANEAIYTREQLLLADNDYNYRAGAGAGGEGAYDDEFTDGCFDQSWDNTGFRM